MLNLSALLVFHSLFANLDYVAVNMTDDIILNIKTFK